MFKLVVACLVFLMSILSYAQTVQPSFEISTIRSGPSTDYSERGSLWSSHELTVTGKSVFDGGQHCSEDGNFNNDLWLRVDLQGIEGWVNYCVVRFEGDVASLPIVEPAYPELDEWINLASIPLDGLFFTRITDELGSTPESPYVVAATRTRNFIHLRANPNLGAEIIDHLSSEQVYVIDVSADGVWVKVEYDARLASCLQNADSVDECPLEPMSGWVARYLLSIPTGWHEILAETER